MAKQASHFPELKRTWWLKHRYFKVYMAREATVVPLIFFIACLLGGLYNLLAGAQGWQAWLAFMQHPVVVVLNLLALAASLFHAWTFFQLFPRVMPLRLNGRTLDPRLMVAGQWVGVGVVILLFAWMLGRGL